MSDTMLIGALRAPYRVNGEITTDPLLLAQLIDRAQEAADRIEADAARIAELEEKACRFYHADGSYEVLESPEAVVEKRKEAARRLADMEANDARWRTARQYLAIEDIERWEKDDLWKGHEPSEEESRKADESIDQLREQKSGEGPSA